MMIFLSMILMLQNGKKEIDYSKDTLIGFTPVVHITVWERVTEESIWRFMSVENAQSKVDEFPLKNHDNIFVSIKNNYQELISYTYKFK